MAAGERLYLEDTWHGSQLAFSDYAQIIILGTHAGLLDKSSMDVQGFYR